MSAAPGSATARAYPNLALVKYWGKRDETLMLPATGSLSLTLDVFPTTTTVTLDATLGEDRLELNGRPERDESLRRVQRFLDLVRERAGRDGHAIVRSHNTVPTGAGLASSASGFAALAAAASAVWGLPHDAASLSRLARRGSGSAARSVVPGIALWHAGHDDASSFAEQIAGPPLAMVLAVIDAAPKAVSSREAMRRTAATSPFHSAWVSSTAATLSDMVAACRAGDLQRIGELTELNALRMHALIQSAEPPIRYLAPASIAVFDRVAALRSEGVGAWATADAGPNVAIVCAPDDAARVARAVDDLARVQIAHAGRGVELVPEPSEAVA
jgi:diphosphomevalonate decarboxylase